jgi:hypothetical protein
MQKIKNALTSGGNRFTLIVNTPRLAITLKYTDSKSIENLD